jgi:1-acyl-sn-glycerol-3-phosphate acyltransferase
LVQPPRRRAPTEQAPTVGEAAAPVAAESSANVTKLADSVRSHRQASAGEESSEPSADSFQDDDSMAVISYPPGDDDDDAASDPYRMSGDDLGMLGIGSPLFPPHRDHDDDDDEIHDESLWNSRTSLSEDDLSVEMRIREIEERLDGLMASTPHDDLDLDAAPHSQSIAPGDPDSAINSAREVLESDYYRKKWGHHSLDSRSSGVDDFGLDPAYEEKLRPALEFLFQKYFRAEVEGIRNIPSVGRAVIVSNHSGALPLDGVMLREAIRACHPDRKDFRWLAEDFSFYLPFLGVAMNRIGAVRACPENAERLLSREHLVAVFPEGAEGIKKLFKNRYRLQRFGRGGFVRLCLKTRSPIIPCAVVGAEETNPILYRFDNLSKLLGLDYLPITPTFPWLGPLGLIPAPTKWKIVFGEPISLDEYGPQAANDHVLVGQISERVRTTINGLLETTLRRRKSIWL